MKRNRKNKTPLLCDYLRDNLAFTGQLDALQTAVSRIDNNIKHDLRDYQRGALMNFIYLINQSKQHKDIPELKIFNATHRLMFYMATGSGKTDIMAGVILHMFQKYHYHNFLYVISKKAVVHQTAKALSDNMSNKYLFHRKVNINGQVITIQPCDSFVSVPDPNTIYICFKTIQGLSNEINVPRENGLSTDDLQRYPLVILADEAHHYNTSTTSTQERDNTSWESTLNSVRQSNKKNYQFEFTATLDIDGNKKIRKKYAPILAYRYDLGQFMLDGYSKQIDIVNSTRNAKAKMLGSVLTSQFRKLFASENLHDYDFKPILMFKSPTKKASKQNEIIFNQLIQSLTFAQLQDYVKKQLRYLSKKNSRAMYSVFNWWAHYLDSLSLPERSDLVQGLKDDFKPRRIINLNSKKDFDNGDFRYLNDLDDPDNKYRVIFEVDKLNEGWDVLNLFDIVRLSYKGTGLKHTMQEAQLIGRGARYYPFATPKRNPYDKEAKYKRCYDGASEQYDLYRILETLFYHTIDDDKYDKNLLKALQKTKTVAHLDSEKAVFSAKITPKFKRSNVYKHGHLYVNKMYTPKKKEYTSLKSFGIKPDSNMFIVLVHNRARNFNYLTLASSDLKDEDNEKTLTLKFKDIQKLIKCIMPSIRFYRFDHMEKVLPITSINDFISRYLAPYQMTIKYDGDLTVQQRIGSVRKVLTRIANVIKKNARKPRGTNVFVPKPLHKFVNNYSRSASVGYHNIQHQDIGAEPMNVKNHLPHTWFAFDYEIGNNLERLFVRQIGQLIPQIKQKLNSQTVYLLRNDEVNGRLSLHDIKGDNNHNVHLDAYMPDFVLYALGSSVQYELYLEPKGTNNVFANGVRMGDQDKWKQNLLEFISPEHIHTDTDKTGLDDKKVYELGNVRNLKLYGIRFYHYTNGGNDTNWNDVKDEIKNKMDLDK